jgi:hypothetical protein
LQTCNDYHEELDGTLATTDADNANILEQWDIQNETLTTSTCWRNISG